MAEAQSPVIVEEDNENTAPPADNRTVGERIEAGEVALADEGKVTTDASGRPRIEIKPVTLQPKPEANVPTQIQVQAAVPPVTFKSLQPEVEQDIERAKEPVLSYESVLEKLDNDETVVIPGPTKSHRAHTHVAPRNEPTPGSYHFRNKASSSSPSAAALLRAVREA